MKCQMFLSSRKFKRVRCVDWIALRLIKPTCQAIPSHLYSRNVIKMVSLCSFWLYLILCIAFSRLAPFCVYGVLVVKVPSADCSHHQPTHNVFCCSGGLDYKQILRTPFPNPQSGFSVEIRDLCGISGDTLRSLILGRRPVFASPAQTTEISLSCVLNLHRRRSRFFSNARVKCLFLKCQIFLCKVCFVSVVWPKYCESSEVS